MHFAILGSGAVGGYYGAKLARAGNTVSFLARGAHLKAMRERGLMVWSVLGDFLVKARAEQDPAAIGPADVVIFAVKTYDNEAALPMLRPLMGEQTVVLTLQNGVESVSDVAAVVGERAVLGGATYVATMLSLPGLIEQTGTHRRIIFGEVFGDTSRVSDRVARIRDAFISADIQAEAVADARVPLWEKFVYLAAFAAFTAAARLPIGPLWTRPDVRETFMRAAAEVDRLARAEGIKVADDLLQNIRTLCDGLPGSTRSSLLIDLTAGKRLEVEALQGSVLRRGRAVGIPTPMMEAMYAVLKPWEHGSP